ncbi:MAG: hypothetical protein ACXVJU_17135 [Candidatus Angelobacter sp.]
MLKVYLDLGQKQDQLDDIVCVAAAMFKPVRYKQFGRAWKRMLKRWKASCFHATDFYNGAKEFKRNTSERERLFEADSELIPELIGAHIQRMLLVAFRPAEFMQKVPPHWRDQLGTSIHSQAVQLCLISNGYWLADNHRRDSFAYFMESGDTDQGEVTNTVEKMRHDLACAAVINVASFTTVVKGMAKGLEAADFAAWHFNKHYMDHVRKGKADEPRRDYRAFIEAARGRVDELFATEANLEYLFSCFPKQT